MAYTNTQVAQEARHNEASANKITAPLFVDQRASTSLQLKQQQLMHAAQTPLQRMGAEEELLQGKFVAQRAEEEELLQGKFATAQLAEDEELLQGKFAPAQLAGMEEEEPIQGKFETAQLAEEDELLQGKFSTSATAQLEEKPNNTGLPNQLKAGIESLSGMSMDSVKVHYNSDKPAQLNAHAYAQGTDIHVAPGQEQHLPHEAWHVVQQAQGRVQPTTQMKGTSVNDDVGLETEADVMGAKAVAIEPSKNINEKKSIVYIARNNSIQRQVEKLPDNKWYSTVTKKEYGSKSAALEAEINALDKERKHFQKLNKELDGQLKALLTTMEMYKDNVGEREAVRDLEQDEMNRKQFIAGVVASATEVIPILISIKAVFTQVGDNLWDTLLPVGQSLVVQGIATAFDFYVHSDKKKLAISTLAGAMMTGGQLCLNWAGSNQIMGLTEPYNATVNHDEWNSSPSDSINAWQIALMGFGGVLTMGGAALRVYNPWKDWNSPKINESQNYGTFS